MPRPATNPDGTPPAVRGGWGSEGYTRVRARTGIVSATHAMPEIWLRWVESGDDPRSGYIEFLVDGRDYVAVSTRSDLDYEESLLRGMIRFVTDPAPEGFTGPIPPPN